MKRASDGLIAHAWVESPLQLVNVIEWAYATGSTVRIHLRSSSGELRALASAVEASLPSHVHLAGEAAAPPAAFALARRRVVGDLFSGQVRALLAVLGARSLALVDDGSSTLHLARVLVDTDTAFGRMARTESSVARFLGAILRRRVISASRAGRVSLFTAYGAAEPVLALGEAGVALERNGYAWVRSLPAGDIGVDGSDVILGSALHVDGMITPDAYAEWLRGRATPGAAYLPHRREPEELRRRWQDELGLTVVDRGLPAELVLMASPQVRHISTLPTSAVATLRTLLWPSVSTTVDHVEESWWTSSADAGIRDAFAELENMEVEGDDSR